MFLGNDPSGEASTNLKRGMVNVVPSWAIIVYKFPVFPSIL
jgi:hypothetical protein